MRRTQSMENLPMLPEEAKVAVSMLRLTLSDRQETSTEAQFQSYISEHSQFPYHRSVPIKTKMVYQRTEPIVVLKSTPQNNAQLPAHSQQEQLRRKKYLLRRRCESSPSSFSSDESKAISASSSRLSQSVPAENQGFFRRFFPFLKRTASTEVATPITTVKAATPPCRRRVVSDRLKYENSGHFVTQFSKMSSNNISNKMDNLIFMSMR